MPFVLGLVAGSYFISLTITGVKLTHYPGDLGDGRFNNYLLEHAHQFFSGNISDFWNAPFMYPEKDVITYSDNLLGSAPFYSLFRIMGCDRELSFQLWFILMTAFNYAACYFFLLYLFRNNYSAVLGALVFAFSMALQAQIGHAQTVPRFAVPLAFWCGLMYLKDLRPHYFFLCILFFVYQFYCGIYLGLLLFIPLVTFIALSFYYKFGVYKLKFKDSRWRIKMLLAVSANVLLILPIMIPYLQRAKETGFYPYENIVESIPTPISYFFSHNGSLFWQFLNQIALDLPAFWDHQIFPGGVAMGCMILFIVIMFFKWRHIRIFQGAEVGTNINILFLTGLFTLLLFLRVDHFSFYRIIYILPGFGSMRALQRIMNIELLFFAIATAFVFKFILFKKQRMMNAFLFVFLTGLVISDNYLRPDSVHNRPVADSKRRVQGVIEKIGKADNKSIISYEPDTLLDETIIYHLDAMLASQSLGLRTLNGYSATSPQGYSPYWIRANKESREVWLNTKHIGEENLLVIH